MRKITCIHFFVGVGFATVQGYEVMALFLSSKKAPELPWGVVQ